MELSFHGADRDVTGSCHRLQCAGRQLLIDCGLFQGRRELEEENAAPLGFDAAAIDFLLLTHAHLDHCGRLPLLVKRGFRGEIIATGATRELAQIVMRDSAHMAVAHGGNVIIPSFALERSQEILYSLRAAVAAGTLPPKLPVYVDSPMAVAAIEVYRAHPECYDAEAATLIAAGGDLFGFDGLRLVRSTAESMALNAIAGGAVIIPRSGMATGGRVRNHLVHNITRPDASIVFVGFAAQGTPARRIIDGARSIMLFGEEVPVSAAVHTINGFSAHADQAELLRWHTQAGGAERTVLVHGERQAMSA